MNFKTSVATLVAFVLAGTAAEASYIQLVDRDTINGGDNTTLISGTIVGTTGFAMLSGGGNHRIVRIDDIGGTNSISVLTNTAAINTALGLTPNGISGTLLASGSDLIILENTTDQVVKIDQSTGVASLLLDDATINALPGVSGEASILFGDINPVNGNPYFFEADTDSIIQVTGVNQVTFEFSSNLLAAVTGDDTPSGLAIDENGVFYFGQNSGTENASFFAFSGPLGQTLFTESDIQAAQGVLGDTTFSSTAFTVVGDKVVFANTGSPDNFISFDADPTTALASLEVVLTEQELLAGPASSDAAVAFTSFNGNIAWVNLLNGPNNAVAGFYAFVPEPGSALLTIVMASLAAIGRGRRGA